MNTYLLLKFLHIISGTVLFGTGIGIAFFKLSTDRSGNIKAIQVVAERIVLADLIFTTPAVIVQPVTGFYLAYIAGFPMASGWIMYAFFLYVVAGCCWLPVLWLQIKMRDIARISDKQNVQLPQQYWKYSRIWFWLGVPAFGAITIVYWLMVFKPTL